MANGADSKKRLTLDAWIAPSPFPVPYQPLDPDLLAAEGTDPLQWMASQTAGLIEANLPEAQAALEACRPVALVSDREPPGALDTLRCSASGSVSPANTPTSTCRGWVHARR